MLQVCLVTGTLLQECSKRSYYQRILWTVPLNVSNRQNHTSREYPWYDQLSLRILRSLLSIVSEILHICPFFFHLACLYLLTLLTFLSSLYRLNNQQTDPKLWIHRFRLISKRCTSLKHLLKILHNTIRETNRKQKYTISIYLCKIILQKNQICCILKTQNIFCWWYIMINNYFYAF